MCIRDRSYVKEGVFDKELSKIIKQAYDYREKADYLDFYIASSEEAGKQIARAEVFKDCLFYTSTQAQLAFQKGEKLCADNCRFVSRLNLVPVCGAKRALYRKCHFASTDDALNGNAVYVGCDFDFYGNRPIYQATGTGAVFID